MEELVYRSAPPLLKGSGTTESALAVFAQADSSPLEIESVCGRVVSFSSNSWRKDFIEFLKARRMIDGSTPLEHWLWVEATLADPDEIWRETAKHTREFFLSRFRTPQGTQWVFVVLCTLISESSSVRLRPLSLYQFKSEEQWQGRAKSLRKIWQRQQEERTPEKPVQWRVALVFGPETARVDKESWARHFRGLEGTHRVAIVEEYFFDGKEPEGTFHYWILDLNTTNYHKATGDFQDMARAAKANPVVVRTPSHLTIRAVEGRLMFWSTST